MRKAWLQHIGGMREKGGGMARHQVNTFKEGAQGGGGGGGGVEGEVCVSYQQVCSMGGVGLREASHRMQVQLHVTV